MSADIFVKFPDIAGEVVDAKHKGEIDVMSYSWGISQTGTQSGGGAGAGKVQVQDFVIVKPIDRSSPRLMEACCRGEHLGDAVVTIANRGGGEQYYQIKLSDCLISSYQTSAGGGGTPAEQIAIRFTGVQVSVGDRRGGVASEVSCNFPSTFASNGHAGHEHSK